MKKVVLLGVLSILIVLPSLVSAQGTLEDYQTAKKFLNSNLSGLVYKMYVDPNWVDDSSQFWYKNTVRGEDEYILVDPEKAIRREAFSKDKLAQALSKATGETVMPNALGISNVKFKDDNKSLVFKFNEKFWKCDLTDYTCEKINMPEQKNWQPGMSPDGNWIAFVKDYNLYVRSVESGEIKQLSFDGVQDFDYATPFASVRMMIRQGTENVKQDPAVVWSPDSRKLVTYRLDKRNAPKLDLVQSVAPGTIRPHHYSYFYPLPGDTIVPVATPVIFHIESGKKAGG